MAQGYCGLVEIEYELTNSALQSISVSPESINVLVKLDNSQEYSSDGRIVLKLPRTLIDVDEEFAVFADELQTDYQEINSTEQYRTIAINFVPDTEMIEILGDGLAVQYACPITLATSYSQYSGSPIVVYGRVRIIENQTLDIKIQSMTTSGSIYDARNVTILDDGTFNQTFNLSMDDREGQYFVYAFYGEFEATAEFYYYLQDKDRTFQPLVLTSTFNGTEYTIYGKSSEGIDVQEMHVSQHGISMDVEAKRDGVIELALPTNVINGLYYVGIGRSDSVESLPFEMVSSNTKFNVVKFYVPKDAWGITIQGLYTVPEFNALSLLVAAVGISSVLALRSRR
jgi:hypothetical protein